MPEPSYRSFVAALALWMSIGDNAHAACKSTLLDLEESVDRYLDLVEEQETFRSSWAAVSMQADIACLQLPPSKSQAGAAHAALGVYAVQVGAYERAAQHFFAADQLAPGAAEALPNNVLGMDQVKGAQAAAGQMTPEPQMPVTMGANWILYVDGVETNSLPPDRPSIVVIQDKDTDFVRAKLVPPGGEPPWPNPDMAKTWAQLPQAPRQVAVASTAMGFVSLALWGFTVMDSTEIMNVKTRCVEANLSEEVCDYTQADIVDMVERRNLLLGGAVVSTSIAVGGGTLAVAWPW